MAEALRRCNYHQWPAERPQLVWSGESGSGLLGGVGLTESIVAFMRNGRIDDAVAEYLRLGQRNIPLKLFRPAIVENLRPFITQGITEELKSLHAADAGWNFYIFLMHTDQRRNLTRHFENLDLHRLELQLPFFDGGFLTAVMAMPLDWCLNHRFYNKWLRLLSPAVTSVPWQAYPGHEPCPLPVSEKLLYQWDKSHRGEEDASRKQKVLKRAAAVLHSVKFPDHILIKRNLRLAAWLHALGWRDYEYAIEAAEIYSRYAAMVGANTPRFHS
jgi:hypothetical protein